MKKLTIVLLLIMSWLTSASGQEVLLKKEFTIYEKLKGEGFVVYLEKGDDREYLFIASEKTTWKKGETVSEFLKTKNSKKRYLRKYTKYPDLSYMLPSGSIGGSSGSGVQAAIASRQEEYDRINQLRNSLGKPAVQILILDVFEVASKDHVAEVKGSKLEQVSEYITALESLDSFHLYSIERGKKKKSHKYKVKIVCMWHPDMPKPEEIDDPKEWAATWGDLRILVRDTKGSYLLIKWGSNITFLAAGGEEEERISDFGLGRDFYLARKMSIRPYKTTIRSATEAYEVTYEIFKRSGVVFDLKTALMLCE